MSYPWPASAITRNEMAILFNLKQETGTPISRLLRQAVVEMGVKYNGQDLPNHSDKKGKSSG